MKPYRIRIRHLPYGNWAVEYRRWPWSFWREENIYHSRATTNEEAMARAKYLLTGGSIIPHEAIVALLRGETA